jgi:hypothetical protein
MKCFVVTEALALALLTMPLSAQVGPEFRVNTSTTDGQGYPRVGRDGSGNFVVAWTEATVSEYSVRARRYTDAGAPLGAEFRVSTSGGYDIGIAPTGTGFVTCWTDSSTAMCQRFSSAGDPAGGTFSASEVTGSSFHPHVASDGVGNFVVVWFGSDANNGGVFARRFSSTGEPLGGDFQVNTTTYGYQGAPSVASDSNGTFLVAWRDFNLALNTNHIFARRLMSTGEFVGDAFRVDTSFEGTDPDVAMSSAGDFVVVWDAVADGSGRGIAGRRFSSSGVPLGEDFRLNAGTTGEQYNPSVAFDSTGGFTVGWHDRHKISARQFKSTGEPKTSVDILVNSYTTGTHKATSVSAGSTDVFIAWESDGQDGSQGGVYARLYTGTCKSADADGNGTVDIADVFYLVNTLFAGGPAPACGGDVDGNGTVDVADVFYLINFLFASGPPPF